MSRADDLIVDFMSYRLAELYQTMWLRPLPAFKRELNFLEDFSGRDIDRWLLVPASYLSEKEAIVVGVASYFSTAKKGEGASRQYFEQALTGKDRSVCSLASFALGILEIESAKLAGGSDRYIKAQQHFLSAISYNDSCHYSKLGLVICLVAQGQWGEVPKLLLQVSRLHCRPGPIYRVLAQIYLKLGLDGPNEFYTLKAKKAELSSAFLMS